MRVYRISSEKYISDLSGEGARLFGGRWNHKGYRVLYTSQSKALAALEVLANTPVLSLPQHFKCLTLKVPEDNIVIIDEDELPADWYEYPSPDALKQLGTHWLQSSESLVCRVPSALIQTEFNYLINPEHHNMQDVIIEEIVPFSFDKRLVQ